MTDKQRTMVAELSKQYKKTGRAFRIVRSPDDLTDFILSVIP